MKKATLRKSIAIHAPREKVWDVLLHDDYERVWLEEFQIGSRAETDWMVGSRAVFRDGAGNGLVARVVANEPRTRIAVEHQGLLVDGREDLESAGALEWKGCREAYMLSGDERLTTLTIEQESPEAYRAMLDPLWDRALSVIKELAEGQA